MTRVRRVIVDDKFPSSGPSSLVELRTTRKADVTERLAEAVYFHPRAEVAASSTEKRCAGVDELALYIHIPFCLTRCYFCTFTVVVGSRVTDELIQRYLSALDRELLRYSELLAPLRIPIKTLQVGGGTPTALSAGQLSWLLETVHARFDCSALDEVIVEGFPTSVDAEKVGVLARYPNLKLNIGVQTLDDRVLKTIGREHEHSQAVTAIRAAVSGGLSSVGVDLIYGLPSSEPDTITADIARVVELGVDHIALYPLWIYPKTKLFSMCESEQLSFPTRETRKAQLTAAAALLERLGFERYTSFHYSLGNRTQHNYGTWQMKDRDWLGLGQGAVSYLNGVLYQNDRAINSYMSRASRGVECSIEERRFSHVERFQRAITYGLRLAPMPLDVLRVKYAIDESFDHHLAFLEERGLVERTGAGVQLTHDGILDLGTIETYLERGELEHV
jgi:oxygen-independent coproporphyrinogen-3 oxidase